MTTPGSGDNTRLETISNFYGSHHRSGNRLGQTIAEEKRVAIFCRWIGREKKVLDIGCRDGHLTRSFLEGNEVVGIDVDQDALKTCEKNLKIETRWCDLSARIPFEDERFEVVVAGEILEHLPYPELTVDEISRALKPGGMFVGSVPNAYHLKNRLRVLKGRLIDYDKTHLQMFNVIKLRQTLEKRFIVEELISSRGSYAFLSLAWFGRDLVWKCRKR